MGGRCAIHAPSCGRQTCLLLLVALLLPRAWPLLIKVYWAIRIWYEVCICLGFSKFSFSYRNIVGTGGFSGRAIMRPQDVVLLDMPSSHSHSLSALGDFLGGPSCGLGILFYWIFLYSFPLPHYFSLVCFFPSPPAIHLSIPHHQVWQCFAHIKHLKHQHITSAWFASSPLHPPFTYLPIPHHQVWQCFAHIKHLKHKHITSGLVCFFPSPLPLVHSLTLPQQVSSAIHGSLVVCMGHLGVHRM